MRYHTLAVGSFVLAQRTRVSDERTAKTALAMRRAVKIDNWALHDVRK